MSASLSVSLLLLLLSGFSHPGAQAETTTLSTSPESNTQDGITSAEDASSESNSIKFKLILDKKLKANGFRIAYKVTYDDHYFQRSETCKIVKREDNENSDFTCYGSTKYHKIDDSAIVANITNHDKYTYSSDGFEHYYFEYESGEYSRLYDSFEVGNLVPREQVLQTHVQKRIAKKFEYTQNGNNELLVTLSVNATDFSLVIREKFTIKGDGDGNFDLLCDGDLKLTDSEYIQDEEFTVCRNIGFLYSNTEIDPEEEIDDDYVEEELEEK